MKRGITALLALALALTGATALAVTQDEARALAAQAVGEGAQPTRVERDDGGYEVSLRGDGATYEVKVSGDGAVVEIEETVPGAGRASGFALTEDEALTAAQALRPGASFAPVLAQREDGGRVYEAFYAEGDAIGFLRLNAETGALVSSKRFPTALAQGGLTPADAAELVASRESGATLAEMDIGEERGRLVYEGEALVSGQVFEFEIDLLSGEFVEWKRD